MRPTVKFALKALFIAGMCALLAWAAVWVDGLFGRNHVRAIRFHWAASAWSLQRVETAPVQVEGVTAGIRVKALLLLSRDIPALESTAALMPFGLVPGTGHAEGGVPLFNTRAEPVIRKQGRLVPAQWGNWKDTEVLPQGLYEVDQVFWMMGVSPIQDRLRFWGLTQTDYFKTRNTTPYRDLNALCREDRDPALLSRLSELDGQPFAVYARAAYLNGDRIAAKLEEHSTDAVRTSFTYHHAAWMEGLKRLSLPDCQAVFQAVEREVAGMAAQIDELARSRGRLEQALERAKDASASSRVEVARRSFTQEALLGQFPGVQCQGADTCRSPRLGCAIEFHEAKYPETTLVPGTVHALGPRDSTAHLEQGDGPHYFLFQPDQPQPCFIVSADQQLLDPRALAPEAPATMRCHQTGCEATVAQWPRDPAWLADKARRAPEIAERLAQVRSVLKSAGKN